MHRRRELDKRLQYKNEKGRRKFEEEERRRAKVRDVETIKLVKFSLFFFRFNDFQNHQSIIKNIDRLWRFFNV